MNSPLNRYFLALIITLFCNVCFAKFIPDEFAHLYSAQKLEVTFELPNNVSGNINVLGNYDGAINLSKDNEDNIKKLMVKSGIKENRLDDILGVIFEEKKCIKFCDDVVVNYDYDSLEAHISVPASYLDGEYIEHAFVEQEADTQGVILNNKLYVSAYDSNFNSTYNLQSLIGVGKGYVNSDLDITSSDNSDGSVSLNELNYDLAMKGHQLSFGYNKYGNNIENITSNLDNTTPNDQVYLALESSNNLLHKGSSSSNKIYFDMKNKGMVTIMRDERIIKNTYFTSGQHYIEYSSLPRGNYEVKIILKPDGMKKEIMYKTINNSTSSRSVNGYDYHLSINNVDTEDTTITYGQGLLNFPFNDNIDFGFGAKSNGQNSFVSLETGLAISDFYATGYLDKMIGKDVSYSKFQANYENFQIDYSQYNSDDEVEFSDAVYGDSSYTQYSIGANFKMFDGRLSLFKNFSSRDHDLGVMKNSSFSMSYSTTIYNDWFIQVAYTKNSNESESYYYADENYENEFNEDSFSVSVNIPLSNDITATSSVDVSGENSARFINSIEQANIVDNKDVNVGGMLTSTVSESDSSVGASINVRNKSDLYAVSGYGYIDSQGDNNINASVESTILIPESYDDIYFTKESSDSYLIVNSNREEMQNGMAYIKSNNSANTSVMLNGNSSIIPVSNYEDYEYELDYESSGFQSNSSTKKSTFTFPGTMSVINSNIKKVVSFMTYFEDFNKESLNNIRCVGDGCVDVTRVGDGIYSISVYDNYDYKIVSNDEYCWVESIGVDQGAGKSRCFPNIQEDRDSGLKIVNHGLGSDDETIIYLGYMKSIPKEVYKKLVENGISPERYEFGNDEFYWFAKLTDTNKPDLIELAKLEVMEEVEQLANNSYELHRYSRVN